ncbi:MAG: preprotein translocase subunit YajC [Lachnospiraceae bacterium]|nr:preprotein translocase subunit YajC [Lachnospiraceae bacterium]
MAESSGIVLVLYVVGLIAIMYFLFIRPQKNEEKRTKAMLADLEVGDYIVTTSGFYGSLIAVEEDTVVVEFGNNRNCRISMKKSAIAQVEKNQE